LSRSVSTVSFRFAGVKQRLWCGDKRTAVTTGAVLDFFLRVSQAVSLSADIPRTGDTMHHSLLEISPAGLVTGLSSAVELRPSVRRQLSSEEGRAIEILGHAIEYLADEYCADTQPKGRLGNADPRIEAIQMLKAVNRSIYYSAAKVEPVFSRVKRLVLGSPTP
jgi:hypothetical protein